MQIEKDRVVTFDYVLTDDAGVVLDKSVRGPMHYLHGAGNIVPGLERALAGLSAGDSFEVVVEPADGYGERDETRQFEVPRSQLGPNVQPQKGMVLSMRAPNGMQLPVTILKVKLSSVVLDGNHQLAGKRLHFTGTIREVRKAKKEELSHRHAHAHGHGH
jgi:FKBP-type peptidyl-prolyl cis-trans isomerase SlyD